MIVLQSYFQMINRMEEEREYEPEALLAQAQATGMKLLTPNDIEMSRKLDIAKIYSQPGIYPVFLVDSRNVRTRFQMKITPEIADAYNILRAKDEEETANYNDTRRAMEEQAEETRLTESIPTGSGPVMSRTPAVIPYDSDVRSLSTVDLTDSDSVVRTLFTDDGVSMGSRETDATETDGSSRKKTKTRGKKNKKQKRMKKRKTRRKKNKKETRKRKGMKKSSTRKTRTMRSRTKAK